MKITPYISDIGQLFKNELDNIYPFNSICRCAIDRNTGEIKHKYSRKENSIIIDNFKFDPNLHELGVYIPCFKFKRIYDSEDGVYTDILRTVAPDTADKDDDKFTVPSIFEDIYKLKPYIIIGCFRGFIDTNGQLRSIPGVIPTNNKSIHEFRQAVNVGREAGKWSMTFSGVIELLQLLYKFAFQNTKTKEVFSEGVEYNKDKKTGSTLALGNRSGCADPFANGDMPNANIRKCLSVVNGRLQFTSTDGSYIRLANGKTLDECIVEDDELYAIYSDGNVTAENPIPDGIYFSCRIDKITGEIYFGKGYTSMKIKVNFASYQTENKPDLTFTEDPDDTDRQFIHVGPNPKPYGYIYMSAGGIPGIGTTVVLNELSKDKSNTFIWSVAGQNSTNHKTITPWQKCYDWIPQAYNEITLGLNPNTDLHLEMWYLDRIGVGFVRSKCPTGKIEIVGPDFSTNTAMTDAGEITVSKYSGITVSREESRAETTLDRSIPIKMIADNIKTGTKARDMFTEEGLYPFTMNGRYILDKDTGEIKRRLNASCSLVDDTSSSYSFNFDNEDMMVLFFPFYAKRNFKGEWIADSMLFEIPDRRFKNGYEVMPVFIDEHGKLRPYVACGAFLSSVSNGQLRSVPYVDPLVNTTMEVLRGYARHGRDNTYNIENMQFIEMVQFLYKIAFGDLNSNKILGSGYTNKTVNNKTGSTLTMGNLSGTVRSNFYLGTVPHNTIESCLSVVAGRLKFYSKDPNFRIKTKDNKTLEQCIVEETDDYVIYSDGDKTAENPIPDGVYFACRIDKHTGEIYYGEGYKNLITGYNVIQPSDNPNGIVVETINPDKTKITINTGLYQYGHKFNLTNTSTTDSTVLFKDRVLSIEKFNMTGNQYEGDVVNSPYFWPIKTIGVTTTPFQNIPLNESTSSICEFYEDTVNDIRFQTVANIIKKIVVTMEKVMLTYGTVKRPYVRTKCPAGMIEFTGSLDVNAKYSYIFKNVKSLSRRHDDVGPPDDHQVFNGFHYLMTNDFGEFVSSKMQVLQNKTNDFDAVFSTSYRKMLNTDTHAEEADFNFSDVYGKGKLSLVPHRYIWFASYKSLTHFMIYKDADLQQNNFISELNKDIYAESNGEMEVTMPNMSLFGIEDFYGHYYTCLDASYTDELGYKYTDKLDDFGKQERYGKGVTYITPSSQLQPGEWKTGYFRDIQRFVKESGCTFLNIPRSFHEGEKGAFYSDYYVGNIKGERGMPLHGTWLKDGGSVGVFSTYNKWNSVNVTSITVSSRLLILPNGE